MKKLGVLLCIVGVLLIGGTFAGTLYNTYRSKQLVEAYETNSLEYDILPGAIDDTDEVTTDQKLAVVERVIGQKNLGEVMGVIKIPCIEVEIPLVEGDRKQDLKIGAGHIPGSAMPGEEGNCVIAGHRSYTFGRFFNRLNEVKLGDEIIIESKEASLTYKVDEIFVVKPEDVWVLEPVEGKHIVTLITCEPVMKATHRLIVRGSLVIENEGVNK